MVAVQKKNTAPSWFFDQKENNSSNKQQSSLVKGCVHILVLLVLIFLAGSRPPAFSLSSSCASTPYRETNVVHKPERKVLVAPPSSSSSSSTTQEGDDPPIVYRKMGLRALKDREDMGDLLEEMGMEVGVEVGVQRGKNAQILLSKWKSCKEFHLVDLWEHQENYVDGANVDQERQNEVYEEAKRRMADYEDKTTFHRTYSTEAATRFANFTLDFAYVDARHDYCGAMEDMNAYWPLLRPGGILAGHDFINNAENRKRQKHDDWGLCMDGTRNEGAVRGAVTEFAMKHGLTISVMYSEQCHRGYIWHSWMMQKPWYYHEN